MNVRELIENLEEFPDEMEVMIRVSDDEVAGMPCHNQLDWVERYNDKQVVLS